MNIFQAIFLTSFIGCAYSADSSEFWYQVRTKELFKGENYRYYCSSDLSIEKISQKISNKEPVIFHNLVAYDSNGKPIPWSKYDPSVVGDILITSDNINAIMPLAGDPKLREKIIKGAQGSDY